MNKPILWLVAVLAPILLISPISAEETASPAVAKAAEVKKPMLTFYYFDG